MTRWLQAGAYGGPVTDSSGLAACERVERLRRQREEIVLAWDSARRDAQRLTGWTLRRLLSQAVGRHEADLARARSLVAQVSARVDEAERALNQAFAELRGTGRGRSGGAVLDLSRLERELAAARWRQAGDPRSRELAGLIRAEAQLDEERRRLAAEQLGLEGAEAASSRVPLPPRLVQDLESRTSENSQGLARVQRRIAELVGQP
jgi:hypothetical protein